MISVFFFNDTATTEIYTLSLHDALPICREGVPTARNMASAARMAAADSLAKDNRPAATLLATSASSPGSKIGSFPFWRVRIFSAFLSMQVSTWPQPEKHDPATSPTYPLPHLPI